MRPACEHSLPTPAQCNHGTVPTNDSYTTDFDQPLLVEESFRVDLHLNCVLCVCDFGQINRVGVDPGWVSLPADFGTLIRRA